MEKSRTIKHGFTLIELMVTILIASVSMLAIGMVIADSHRGYRRMFTRIHGGVVDDAYVARLLFDKICRSSSGSYEKYDEAVPSEVQVYLYSNNISPGADPDQYARFYLSGTDLMLERGSATYDEANKEMTSGAASGLAVVVGNVMELKFDIEGSSVQMVLTLDDGEHGLTVTCTSIRHN